MVKVKDILNNLLDLAPMDMKMDFDNPGFLVGNSENEVSKILLALDITDRVVDEAVAEGADLIVSHHPLFFSLKNVTDTDRLGRKAAAMIRNNISAICMHTNLDAAKGGVNDALAAAAGIVDPELITVEGVNSRGEEFAYGRCGYLAEPTTMAEYLPYIKNALGANGLRYHDAGIPVHKVGVVGGAGSSELHCALEKGCDTYLTSDIKYDTFLEAAEAGINIIDGDHFCTENLVIPVLLQRLSETFPDAEIIISKAHHQTTQFYI